MKKSNQISESVELGIFLALAGGFMDAYSYICRGGVFANAQTGNILLVGVNLSEGNVSEALRYVCPILAFVIGIALASIIRYRLLKNGIFHWRQIAVLVEVLILASVGFIPQTQNLLANSLTSLACGIQVQSFRKIRGNGIATTMCIGNLRTATQAICDYWHTKDKMAMEKGMLFYGIIITFVIGAILGNVCIKFMAEKAMLICTLFLVIGFMLMFIDREKQKEEERLQIISEK